MSSPKSSYVWLRFMAFQVSVGANDEAREVAERALKAGTWSQSYPYIASLTTWAPLEHHLSPI